MNSAVTASSSSSLPAPPPSAPRVTDFADWLSPILVKELRQGLKTRAFITVFILLQAMMVLVTGIQLLETAQFGRSGGMDGVMAFMLVFALMVLMPSRGLVAVSEEVRANTLDLVQLTRLSAFRIVLGKWVALVAQTLLLVTAILPYAVLRYFFGRVDVVQDLQVIGVLVVASMVLTAGALALSSAHVVIRIIVVLGMLFGVLGPMFELVSRFGYYGGGPSLSMVGLMLWMAVLYIYLLLEIAASRIAPLSENHSAPKKVVILLMVFTAVLLDFVDRENDFRWWMVMSSPAALWVMIESMAERTVTVPSAYAWFARRGALGRLLGRVFYPGWASGVVFILGLVAVVAGLHLWRQSVTHPERFDDFVREAALVYPTLGATILFPLVFMLLFPRAKQPVWIYILIQALCGLLYVVVTVVRHAPGVSSEDAFRWLAPLPPCVMISCLDHGVSVHNALANFFRVTAVPVSAIIILYLLFRTMKEFRAISQLEAMTLPQPVHTEKETIASPEKQP